DGEINRLEKALFGKDRGVCRIGEYDVGIDGIVLHHGFDLGGVGIGSAGYLDAGLVGECLEIRDLESLLERSSGIVNAHALWLGSQQAWETYHRKGRRDAGGTCQEMPTRRRIAVETSSCLSSVHGLLPIVLFRP